MSIAMSPDPDYYAVLHVNQDAPLAVIRASYRTLMQSSKQHPDLGGEHDAAVLLNEAYAVLSNAKQRKAYDASRKVHVQSSSNSGTRLPSSKDHVTRKAGAIVQRCLFCGSNAQLTDNCSECFSPLQRVQQLGPGQQDQRALQRLPHLSAVTIQTHWQQTPIAGRCEDLSPQGMRLKINHQLHVNALVRINSDVCHAVARLRMPKHTNSTGTLVLNFLPYNSKSP